MKRLILLITILIFAACTPSSSPVEEPTAPAETEARSIVLGDISDDPGEVIEGAQPLADYLAERLSDYGITAGEVRVTSNAEEMIALLESGEVDLYFDSVYPATLISDASDAQPFLRRWRRGVAEYYTILFTTPESGIESVEDLEGNIVAMDNPFSTSGFVLPAVFLTEQDLSLQGLADYDQAPPEDAVGFVFSFDDENTLQWVLNGLVDAGATDNVSFERLPEDVRSELVILGETDPVPRQVAVAAPDVEPELLDAITQILLEAHTTDEGAAALEAFDTTAQFDEFPDGIDQTLDRMRELREIVQDIPLP